MSTSIRSLKKAVTYEVVGFFGLRPQNDTNNGVILSGVGVDVHIDPFPEESRDV